MQSDITESHDFGSEALREADQDAGEFDNLADEGDGVHEILEPGDLVALAAYVNLSALADLFGET